MSKPRRQLNASTLRIILSLMLVITAGVIGATFIYGQGALSQYSIEVSHKKIDADASNGTIAALQRVKQGLDKDQDVVQKIESLKATNELPQFKIVDDITNYAKKNNITITNFDFAEAAATSTSSVPTSPSTSATPNTAGQSAAPASGKYVSIVVTLNSPINYIQLLQFIYDIEQSLPKMQVAGIGLTSDGQSAGNVTVDALTIQMYTK